MAEEAKEKKKKTTEEEEHECEECPPKGAPAWMATFADMATLLMAFFVLILSFAEFNVPKFKQISGSLKNAFGIIFISNVKIWKLFWTFHSLTRRKKFKIQKDIFLYYRSVLLLGGHRCPRRRYPTCKNRDSWSCDSVFLLLRSEK